MYCAELYAGITTVTAGAFFEEPTLSVVSVEIIMNHLSSDDGTTGARLSTRQPRVSRQPFLPYSIPFVARAFLICVARNRRSELRRLQQTDGPCSHRIVIVSRHQQTGLLVSDDATNAAGTRRYYRHARGKRLEYRTRHVVDVGTVEKDMRLVVQLVHLVWRNASAELNISQTQLKRQRFQRCTLAAVAREDQPRLGKPLLDLRKRSQNTCHVIQRIEIAIREKDRQQWFALLKLEPIRIDDVRHRGSAQTKLPKHVDEILRRNDQLIR